MKFQEIRNNYRYVFETITPAIAIVKVYYKGKRFSKEVWKRID